MASIKELKLARIAKVREVLARDFPNLAELSPQRQQAAQKWSESDEAVLAIEAEIAKLRPQVDQRVEGVGVMQGADLFKQITDYLARQGVPQAGG